MDLELVPKEMNALAFHIPRLFDKIIDIRKCWLQPSPSNELRNFIREYALENELSFFDIRKQEGLLHNMIVRTSSTGEPTCRHVSSYTPCRKCGAIGEKTGR